MAYINQERKAKIAPAVKAILKKYGVKGSLAVENHSTLHLNIKSGCLDFIGNYHETLGGRFSSQMYYAEKSLSVNPYWYHENFTGTIKDFLKEVLGAMNNGNWDNSRSEIDYFDVGWYVSINVGRWNKPYLLES